MEFKQFNKELQKHIIKMSKNQEYLFVVDLDSDTVWNTYLDSFPEGTNKIFRERREYDCSCCRHFIRDLGRVVSIKDNKVTTIWDFETGDSKFQIVINALSELIKSQLVANVCIPISRDFGTKQSIEHLKNGEVYVWDHFQATLSASIRIFNKYDIGAIQGRMRDVRNVLQRSFKEISSESVDTVLELIAQKSLYKGEEWQSVLTSFKNLQKKYLEITDESKQNLYCWETSVKVGPVIGKIKNHSIGVLLTDISEGMDLDAAVRRYEAIVAPSNYKRPKAIFTKKMIAQAQETVRELGFEHSLGRRFAQMEDITVNNTLFANRNAKKAMSNNPFDELVESLPDKPKNLSKIEEISIDNFIKDVLPRISELEILLENKHVGNMVSLIAPQEEHSKSMLKWDNNFSWAYSGNITDSMKERVKAAGGRVDGVLRFSIQWNDNGDTLDDLDAHCLEPLGNQIYFRNKVNPSTTGNLDVDIVNPNGVAVENITWSNKSKMLKGKYLFVVHNYTSRRGKAGFTAEIEFDGEIFSFDYPEPLRQDQKVVVAEVDFDGESFKIQEKLPSNKSSREIWELASNKFHQVTIAMHSPNYWDDQQGIGHKHYFFMLDGCKNSESPNGFFNEFLNQELMQHKRVFEALGFKMRVEDSGNQLSGLGFSSTKRAEIVCRVKGSFERLLKIKF